MLLYLVTFLYGVFHLSANTQPAEKPDMASTDIVAANKLNGASIRVYGFYLGMRKAEAKLLLQQNPKLTVDHGSWNILDRPFKDSAGFSTFIFDTDSAGKMKNSVLYLAWEGGNPGLAQITVFNTFKEHAKGKTKALFTSDIVNPATQLYKTYFSKADSTWPGSQFSSYFYKKINIQCIENKYQQVPRYYIMLTKKAMFW